MIVEFEIKYAAQQFFRIDEEIYTLEDNQGRQYDADTPFGLDNSIGFGEQVDPGVTQSVTVAFDVPPNQTDRRLLIEPAGTFSNADTHQVILTIWMNGRALYCIRTKLLHCEIMYGRNRKRT